MIFKDIVNVFFKTAAFKFLSLWGTKVCFKFIKNEKESDNCKI